MVTDVAQQLQDQILKRMTGQSTGQAQQGASGDIKETVRDRLKGIFGR